ncbi:TPA: hypothetical protein EYO12_02595 [Candidatus Saccharibacteria bacterium]|nr:hypothetical protein [Candidatus Saccharibacteria bacterium]HIO88072.1 hypothetical protein [Candidatus Saccharibacteria bacterium]
MSYDQAYEQKNTKNIDAVLKVKVQSQFEVFYEGEAESVSALNKTGPFDILGGHANFLSILEPCEVLVRKDKDHEEKIPVEFGVIHVNANAVTVFVDV